VPCIGGVQQVIGPVSQFVVVQFFGRRPIPRGQCARLKEADLSRMPVTSASTPPHARPGLTRNPLFESSFGNIALDAHKPRVVVGGGGMAVKPRVQDCAFSLSCGQVPLPPCCRPSRRQCSDLERAACDNRMTPHPGPPAFAVETSARSTLSTGQGRSSWLLIVAERPPPPPPNKRLTGC